MATSITYEYFRQALHLELWLDGELRGDISSLEVVDDPDEELDMFGKTYTPSNYRVLFVRMMKDNKGEDMWCFPLKHYDAKFEADKERLVVQSLKEPLPNTAELQVVLPGLLEETQCPVCGEEYQLTLWNVIIHINDAHKKSREYIADWLERLDIDLTFRTEVKDDNDNSRGTDDWEFYSYEHPTD